MPIVMIGLTEEQREAIDMVAAKHGGTFSAHVVKALKEWEASDNQEFVKVKGGIKNFTVSYNEKDEALMTKRGPIPFSVIVRSAIVQYLKQFDIHL